MASSASVVRFSVASICECQDLKSERRGRLTPEHYTTPPKARTSGWRASPTRPTHTTCTPYPSPTPKQLPSVRPLPCPPCPFTSLRLHLLSLTRAWQLTPALGTIFPALALILGLCYLKNRYSPRGIRQRMAHDQAVAAEAAVQAHKEAVMAASLGWWRWPFPFFGPPPPPPPLPPGIPPIPPPPLQPMPTGPPGPFAPPPLLIPQPTGPLHSQHSDPLAPPAHLAPPGPLFPPPLVPQPTGLQVPPAPTGIYPDNVYPPVEYLSTRPPPSHELFPPHASHLSQSHTPPGHGYHYPAPSRDLPLPPPATGPGMETLGEAWLRRRQSRSRSRDRNRDRERERERDRERENGRDGDWRMREFERDERERGRRLEGEWHRSRSRSREPRRSRTRNPSSAGTYD